MVSGKAVQVDSHLPNMHESQHGAAAAACHTVASGVMVIRKHLSQSKLFSFALDEKNKVALDSNCLTLFWSYSTLFVGAVARASAVGHSLIVAFFLN
jgi:hypothetical protein